jgi:hypothetical protein
MQKHAAPGMPGGIWHVINGVLQSMACAAAGIGITIAVSNNPMEALHTEFIASSIR